MASTGETWRLGRRPALDGLRGVAILLVVVSHALPHQLVAAGPAGVTVFFVLSGFLITSLLLEEHARSGRISLAAFYLRRARRLFPALAVFLAGMLALGIATWWQVLPVAAYVGNWITAAGWSLGKMPHTWSLAVEEQFYLVFPALAVLLLRRSRKWLIGACAVGVVLSFVARAGLWAAGASIDRVYAGSDTNAGALLLGCLVALFLHGRASHAARPRLVAAALALVACLGVAPEGAAARVWVPVLAVPLAVVAVVWVAGDEYRGFLEARWLRLVGRRSYALYLWHLPLIWAFGDSVPGPRWVGVVLLLAASWVLALASWRFVEAPFLRASSRSRQPAGTRPAVTVPAGRSVALTR